MEKPKIKLFFLPVASLLMISACTVPTNGSTMTPTLPITNMVSVLSTVAVPPSSPTPIIVTATPTIALTATETLIPTLPYTPTSSIPLVTVSVGTNCREGPGIIYNLLDGLMVGEQAQIVKLASAGVDYVVIQRPHGPGECWLWLQYATITGNLSQLPIAPIPPTPTSTATSIPTATVTPTSPFVGTWTMKIFEKNREVTLTQTGDSITGTFTTEGGNSFSLVGTVSMDGKTVTGTFDEKGVLNGTFSWYLLGNSDQFNGHGYITYPSMGPLQWCGYRAGQPPPDPCLRGP